MKVEAIQTAGFRIPLARPWGDQTHSITHIELVIADLQTDAGVAGTGFAYTVGTGARAVEALIDWYVAPALEGTVVAPRAQWWGMWRAMHDAGGGGLSTMAIAACDIALWDVLAKAQGRPLTAVLGQFRPAIPAYASGVNLNLGLGALEEQVRRWLDRGYRSFKVKVGHPEPAADLERLAMVRRIIGPGAELMVDANQGWDVVQAERAIRTYEHLKLAWVEEPLLSDDIAGHAALRRRVPQPLAMGENVYTAYQFNDYLRQDACDIVQADVVRVGGITPWLEIAALARVWGRPMAPHFMLELSGQLLCCIPNALVLEDVEGGSFRELGILAEDVGVESGRFAPPERPGHGIVFDRERLSRYAGDGAAKPAAGGAAAGGGA